MLCQAWSGTRQNLHGGMFSVLSLLSFLIGRNDHDDNITPILIIYYRFNMNAHSQGNKVQKKKQTFWRLSQTTHCIQIDPVWQMHFGPLFILSYALCWLFLVIITAIYDLTENLKMYLLVDPYTAWIYVYIRINICKKWYMFTGMWIFYCKYVTVNQARLDNI